VAGSYRYARAVRDQTAEENLRLLVQAMHGLAAREELWVSDFLKFADILAALSRDEIILIGRMMAEDAAWARRAEPMEERPSVWHLVTISELGGLFESEAYLTATAGRAVRSGLIIAQTGWGSLVFELSPQGRQAREFLNIDAALYPSKYRD
jgi:hypothetical protein